MPCDVIGSGPEAGAEAFGHDVGQVVRARPVVVDADLTWKAFVFTFALIPSKMMPVRPRNWLTPAKRGSDPWHSCPVRFSGTSSSKICIRPCRRLPSGGIRQPSSA